MFSDLDEIKALIQNQIDRISEQLANGLCEDWEQYQNLTGMIEGLTRSLHMIDEYVLKTMDQLEEDEE